MGVIRYLLDTGIASDYINKRHGVHDRARAELAKGNRIGIGVPVLAELTAGIEGSRSRDKNMLALRAALPSFRIWQFDMDAAFEYGRIVAELTALGRPIGEFDMMIAAIARGLRRCTVVSCDSDYSNVPRLSVENWRI
jgi:tRNA(fMet)-specific endonuclease VapC